MSRLEQKVADTLKEETAQLKKKLSLAAGLSIFASTLWPEFQQEAILQNPAVTEKEWIHTGEYRNEPRENHVEMNGQRAPKAEPFWLRGADGVIYFPQFPRDPELPAGEAVNCHCIHRGIADWSILGLPLEERQELQENAVSADDEAWKKELDAKNRAKADIDETLYKPDEIRYSERQAKIHADILENYNLSVNIDKQNRHIEGKKGYKEGRSVLTANPEMPIKRHAGKSQAIVSKGEFVNGERFIHTSDIGIYRTRDGRHEIPAKHEITHYHYAKEDGVHVVPAKPPEFVIPKGEVPDK